MEQIQLIRDCIRNVPDFPKPGIQFKDITPVLSNPAAFDAAIEALAAPYKNSDIDLVVGIEARGFIFGTPVARLLDVGFVPIRKPGKLPWKTHSTSYELEYGSDALEIHA
ncbi:MAG: adenine phosphoribosyltransferase, partial [Candidatus Poseidoniia archaeon]|nr:adenine phosphoribosyltransferase [Candidatus Poseidoniia archaeon]